MSPLGEWKLSPSTARWESAPASRYLARVLRLENLASDALGDFAAAAEEQQEDQENESVAHAAQSYPNWTDRLVNVP